MTFGSDDINTSELRTYQCATRRLLRDSHAARVKNIYGTQFPAGLLITSSFKTNIYSKACQIY